MIIKNYPQYRLFKFTNFLKKNRNKLIYPKDDTRPIDSTIINRAYYSSFSYAYLWLEEKFNFKPKQKWEYELDGEKYETEHMQVINTLKENDEFTASKNLSDLHKLRKQSDYQPYHPLDKDDIKNAVILMNNIFDKLKF